MGGQEWKPCSRGVCAADDGHEGTCDEASGWAPEPVGVGTREALAARELACELREAWRGRTLDDGHDPLTAFGDIARTVSADTLASDWLAARDAAAEKRGAVRALREAVEAHEIAFAPMGAVSRQWLRDRADREAGQ